MNFRIIIKLNIILVLTIVLTVVCAIPLSKASEIKYDYPKVANYYLQPWMPEVDARELYKYDLIILDADADIVNPGLLADIKSKNPKAKILAYIPSQGVNVEDLNTWAVLRNKKYKKINNNDWWMLNSQGDKISFNNTWPYIKFVDPGKGWVEFLSDLAKEELNDNSLWDGVFYDMVFANLSWLNGGDIDLNRDGKKDNIVEVNKYWMKYMDELMNETRKKIGEKYLVTNVDIFNEYTENANGGMLENFPAKWLGSDSWSILVNQYVNELPSKNIKPNIYIVNSNTNNAGYMNAFTEMRFGMTSTLLGNGYFSFDLGDQNHSQVWWYDEYDSNLGQPLSEPYNLLDKNNKDIKPGLWRRDFEYGTSLVNSTKEKQTYIFSKEELEKINGTQDRRINNGEKINYVSIEPNDGIVLLKIDTMIRENSYNNGSFVRVFDINGNQTRNGFFSYSDSYAGNAQILNSDIDNDGVIETLVNGGGTISVYDNGLKLLEFSPYDGKFKGEISFAVSDLNGDGTKEIITGAGLGGGPHVRVFTKDGKPLIGGFFAYDENFRGGVNVAVFDLNGDGTKEIITGAGMGGGPHVRVFTKDGKPLIGGFFAYDENFRGGISVASGDLDGDGIKEIITGAGIGGGPYVKVFSKDGAIINQFYAYEKNLSNGVRVMSDDIGKDGNFDIVVSQITD